MVRALARHPCPTHAGVRSLYEAAPRLLMRSGAKSRTGLGAFASVVALGSQVRGLGERRDSERRMVLRHSVPGGG